MKWYKWPILWSFAKDGVAHVYGSPSGVMESWNPLMEDTPTHKLLRLKKLKNHGKVDWKLAYMHINDEGMALKMAMVFP